MDSSLPFVVTTWLLSLWTVLQCSLLQSSLIFSHSFLAIPYSFSSFLMCFFPSICWLSLTDHKQIELVFSQNNGLLSRCLVISSISLSLYGNKNHLLWSIYYTEFSNHVRFHKNLLQRHGNMGPTKAKMQTCKFLQMFAKGNCLPPTQALSPDILWSTIY